MTKYEGYITRIEAQSIYDRSKTSFIRDVDQARERGDSDFLENFMVVLKDDTTLSGVEATKDALKSNDHLKPEWYIKESLLETRYWHKGKKSKATSRKEKEPKKTADSKADSPPRSAEPYVALLEQTNADLRAQNERQHHLIVELTNHQKQSNVLFKSLTNLLQGDGSNEAFDALGVVVTTKPQEKASIVDAEPVEGNATRLAHKEGSDRKKSIWQKDIFWLLNKQFRK